MSIYNEEEFKINLNGKIYLINISIIDEQLSLVLAMLSQPPKQYSAFFSLEELRISSKIFGHMKSLFEAKEIIKRTVIKNQLAINEDEHKAQITFDTGMGLDSIPFPITLFRDLNVNHLSKSQILTTSKNLMENNNQNKLTNNFTNDINQTNNKKNNEVNINQNVNFKAINRSNIKYKLFNNIKITQSEIISNGNDNINNEMNKKKINRNDLKNVVFNNKRSRIFLTNSYSEKNFFKYKKVDFNRNNNIKSKDYIKMNNQILFYIYNNMYNNRNTNSSFYKNLQNSFISVNKNIQNDNNNEQNNLLNFQQNSFQNKMNNPQTNNNIPILNLPINNPNLRGGFLSLNNTFKTSPIENNITPIPINDSMKSFNLTKNVPKDNNRYENIFKNDKDYFQEKEENSIFRIDENIDELNFDEKNYHFKNLVINRPKKMKENLEKFKQSQNMGDYTPIGKKYVSYLKFPDTNSNISSNNASTLSSSINSSLNRIPGLEKNIIKTPAELDEINGRIKRILNKRNVKYKLIFRGKEHGDLSSSFHEKCDNINNTLILIHTSCNKRFGGFTTQTWDGEDIKKKDNNSFIFSIDKMRIYDIIQDKNAIYCNPDYGPVFINQIKLLDKFFTQGGSTGNKGKNFQTLENFELTDGAKLFGIKEVEVYQVK